VSLFVDSYSVQASRYTAIASRNTEP